MAYKDSYYVNRINFNNIKSKQIKSNEYYKILFIFEGNCEIKWGYKSQDGNKDSIILISPNNSIEVVLKLNQTITIYELVITTELLNILSDEDVNLAKSFNSVSFGCNVVNANTETTMLIKNILKKLYRSKENKHEFAESIYIKSMLSIVVVMILRSCIYAQSKQKIKRNTPFLIDDIFAYISNHITEEISLDCLEREFYISKFHISREFKKLTGTTLHKYIVKAKLDLCKKLIEEGKSITDIAQICNLGSYNNLFRVFKKEFGITPKEYYNEIKKYK
ncbi:MULTISPECIES: helix-turn-helix domain-containing protein [Romboutsia]|jgi:AraC-like DNA-binding protein|uniref:helix-turn-helix domain-containing protein n=1 Tax=Romboutsia TaxID=1501226 RepID=UPI00216FF4DD|nr:MULTISPECIES: AraC family transcriptional regulator [Romboutsia]MCI9060957.1 helix-turn-helix transcriptional regulator [Romboutsia sp.]